MGSLSEFLSKYLNPEKKPKPVSYSDARKKRKK
jgi:hypothetical protein